MSLAEIAEAVGGRLSDTANPETRVTGPVEHDSRKIEPGSLFVAFTGEHADGHDFAAAAVADGAVAALVSREVDAPSILVDDVQLAFGKLARAVVDRLPELKIIGVTGSAGKTSTKDVMAELCRALGPTVAPEGTLNNEIGLPYTVLKVDETTRYLVLEYSARGIGHIDYLCGIAPPGIAVVINVGTAHMGEFGTVDGIARAKGELAEAVAPGGVVILNADDARVAAMRDRARARVVTFGEAESADIRATDVVSEAGQPRFTLHTPNGSAPVALKLYGAHHVSNTLAAAAVAVELGMAAEAIASVVSGPLSLSPRRMDVFTRADGTTVIDDSYNANPSSMAAAINALADLGKESRKIAVLGYMAELGDETEAAHLQVGELAARNDIDIVISVEEVAAAIAEGAGLAGSIAYGVDDQAEAIAKLDELLDVGDVVLVKGSRYRTWKVADYLRETRNSTKEAKA
nr:UDP-N-acetylmuramoyl-tripeptide--D-alanyl-D-alanine ligase [Stackebrandtia nassauensis]